MQQHFPAESKKAVEAMVADLKAAFATRIDRLAWMTPATKARAKEKLQALVVGVGYPEQWRDYSSLDISRTDAIGNAVRADLFEYRYRVAKLSKPIDRGEWWMTPQTVNAVNLPIQNALKLPATRPESTLSEAPPVPTVSVPMESKPPVPDVTPLIGPVMVQLLSRISPPLTTVAVPVPE